MNYIVTKNIHSNYLKNVSFNVEKGNTVSILSTNPKELIELYNILFDLIRPSKGDITVRDKSVSKHSKLIKSVMAGVPSEIWYDDNLTVGQFLSYKKHTNGTMDIGPYLTSYNLKKRDRFIDISPDNRKLVYILGAIQNNPEILVINLYGSIRDIKIYKDLEKIIADRKQNKLTTVLLTDNLALSQKYCSKIYYLYNKTINYVEDMVHRLSSDKIITILDEDVQGNPLESIGGLIINDNPVTIFYNGSMDRLTEIMYQNSFLNYTIKDANLDDKIKYFRSIENENI